MTRIMVWSLGMAVAVGSLSLARAGEPAQDGFDWNIWKSIVVHDGKQFRLYTMHPDVNVHFAK